MITHKSAGYYLKFTSWENDYDNVKEEIVKMYDLQKAILSYNILTIHAVSGYHNKLGMSGPHANFELVENHITNGNFNYSYEEMVNLLEDLVGYTEQGDFRVAEQVEVIHIATPWEYDNVDTTNL